MATYETIAIKTESRVTHLSIEREKQLNALSPQVIREMTHFIEHDLPADTRILVIRSAGDKAFVAGADISEMRDMTPPEAEAFSLAGQKLTTLLECLSCVTIARVQGFALGGGCELAMACDLVIASETAKFGQPEVNLGLIAGFGGTQRLVRRVGLPVALDMLLCGQGRTLSGSEAHALGLVSRVAKPEDLDLEVGKAIRGILKTGPKAVALTKRLCRAAYDMSLTAGLQAESSAFGTVFASGEAKEGLNAFLDKRPASFT